MNLHTSGTRGPAIKAQAFLLMLVIAAAQPLILPAQSAPQLPDPGKTSLSREEQKQLGLKASAEVYKQMPVLPDSSPITQYVQKLGKKLEAVIPPEHSWPYQFHVVPQKEINAFALPGGPIFINLGTIQAAENEAELAGVMAHEMSHVYMQHSAKQMGKAQWTGLLAGIAGAVMPQSGLGNLARAGIQMGAGTVMMKYSRTDEAQADSVGAVIMYNAGYDPHALADFFAALEKKSGNGGPQFLNSHPNPGNRQAAIAKEVQAWPHRDYHPSSPGFYQARQEAEAVKSYSAEEIQQGAKQGIWAQQNSRNGALPMNAAGEVNGPGVTLAGISLRDVRPSPVFLRVESQAFAISYPDNWKAAGGADGERDAGSLLIAPPQGAASGAVAYGVVIAMSPAGSSSDLDDGTHQVVQALLKENVGSRVISDARPIEVNGVPGRSAHLAGNSPVQRNGRPAEERNWVVTLPRPKGGLLYLVFVAPESDFHQLEPVYQKMLHSVTLK